MFYIYTTRDRYLGLIRDTGGATLHKEHGLDLLMYITQRRARTRRGEGGRLGGRAHRSRPIAGLAAPPLPPSRRPLASLSPPVATKRKTAAPRASPRPSRSASPEAAAAAASTAKRSRVIHDSDDED